MNQFIPIALYTIRVDTKVGCDLYLQNNINGKEKYVLYCSEVNTIKSSTIEELQKHKIQRLFIREEDLKKYLEYVELGLIHVINDDNINIQEKAQVMYDVAKNIMIDIFANPRSGENINRSRRWTDKTIDLIMKNKESSLAMINILSYDYYTYTHSVNVAVLGLLFSKYIGIKYNEMNAFGTGLLLHDVGKSMIDSEIINKKGRLNNKEFAKIQMHVEYGVNILVQTGDFDSISFFPVMQHHEKYNGKGYPNGLNGNEIHEYGKIACIIDVYDALTTKRSYADARKPFSALQIMKEEMQGSFDKKLFNQFVLFLGSQTKNN